MKKGFTLVELMVVVVVIAVVSSAILLSWEPARESFDLRHAAFQIAGDLRRIQQLSLSTQQFHCSPLPAEDHTGYGLYLNTNSSTSYQVFENCNDANRSWDSGEEQQTLSLTSGVSIQGLKVGGSTVNSLSILFVPPNPDTYINENSGSSEAEITLTNGTTTAVIKINNSGRIEVE